MKTRVHKHRWVNIGFVGNVPTPDGQFTSYHIMACKGCMFATPEPSENYLMSTNEHKNQVESEVATLGLKMCFTGEES